MRVLIVASYLPYPLFSGGAVRLYNLLKVLSKKHKITLISEIRANQTREDIKQIQKLCEDVFTIARRPQWSLSNITRAAFSKDSFLVVGHTLTEMKDNIVRILAQKHFDVIHVETSYIMQNVPKTYIPIVLVEHNIEYLVYERYMQHAPWYIRPLLFIDIQKLKIWEINIWKKCKKLVAVSETEKLLMNKSDVEIVPNGVDMKKFRVRNIDTKLGKKEKRVLFIGDFKWIQNQNAAKWILEEIWPFFFQREISELSGVKLWLVGKRIPINLKSIGGNNVIFDEHAPDATEKIYQRSYLLLAPMKVGGGTSYKILEAMASGVPVVTTRLGIEGLGGIRPGKEVLIGETKESLAAQVKSLLLDNVLYKDIAFSARTFVEKHFSWDEITKKLENVYESAIKI